MRFWVAKDKNVDILNFLSFFLRIIIIADQKKKSANISMGVDKAKKEGVPKKKSTGGAKVKAAGVKRALPDAAAPPQERSVGMEKVLAQHPINRLDEELAGKAVDALLAFSKKRSATKGKKDLLDETDGEKLHMQITLKKVPQETSPKPIALAVPHPVRGSGVPCEVCIFVKKEDKPWVKDLLIDGDSPVEGVKKVITLDSLRTSYKRFEARRELLSTYDLFLADDAIVPMLCKALGKTFYDRKKQPVPLRLKRKESLPRAIQAARDGSTYMFLSSGTCVSVCVGTTAMPRTQLLANLAAVLPAAVARLPRKWKGVQAVQLKTSSSLALPILNKLPFIPGMSEATIAANSGGAAAKGESDDEASTPVKMTTGMAKAVLKAAKAAADEVEEYEAESGKKRRGQFERKLKAAPAQHTKKEVAAPSAKKAKK